MTAIGRPLRGAQLVAPPFEPRVSDGRAAAAARQRAAIRSAFRPLAGSIPGGGSLRPRESAVRPSTLPRSAVVPGARPRGRIGVSAWRATNQAGILGASTGATLGAMIGISVAAFALLYLSLSASMAAAKIRVLQDEQIRIVEQVRLGEMDMDRLGRESAVRRRASELGVSQLANPLVVVIK
jgi:hypothetical protein